MIFPGIESYREGQDEIVRSVLQGQDLIAVLPTGGGKSLCYQAPAFQRKGLVIVVSPLIALMKDQVMALWSKGVRAGALHSGQSYQEKLTVFRQMQEPGEFILYLSPERVQKEGFKKWIMGRKIELFAIDEAHCVSQWGHDFREEYAELRMLKMWRPDVPLLALTASATPLVLDDIGTQLGIKKAKRFVYGFYRSNLYYQVENCADEDEKTGYVQKALSQFTEGRRLIYAGTRKTAESLAALLSRSFDQVGFYHAGLSTEERTRIQNDYVQGQIKTLVATNAFGMGIDQPDVRIVIHYQMPANIDSLYQEMGRAGRDGKPSTCLMLYSKKDKGLQAYFIESSEASKEIKSLRWRNLEALVDYSEGGECRHKEILTYFRDARRLGGGCGHCDSCAPDSHRKVQRPEFEVVATLSRAQTKKSFSKVKKFQDSPDLLDPEQMQLVEKLKAWRKQEASSRDVPAFLIFSDKTLREIARHQPQNSDSLQRIKGIGDKKFEEFGRAVLEITSSR